MSSNRELGKNGENCANPKFPRREKEKKCQ